MCNDLKIGNVYKNFKVLNIFELKDYHSKAINLIHIRTGLQILHLLNDDTENLFAFAFRTPNDKSNGAAHILEHSVLCGSENYPIKDPFTQLSNQSVKTYLNAATYPDRTVFPASSMVKSDYYNLMSVYGDAVFFPKLTKEIFLQEAHRLTVDENNVPSIQGVVYNEMKGSYASFESVCYDENVKSLMNGSIYQKDSGGDPIDIPSITYQELIDFHNKWYRPDNCFVFLYGNIPTLEQLDFIQEKFLTRLEKKYTDLKTSVEEQQENLDNFLSIIKSKKNEKEIIYNTLGPAVDSDEKGMTVSINWNMGTNPTAEKTIEKTILYGVLMNHDGSPLKKVLLDSKLCEDISPITGFSASYEMIFTIGLRGVKKRNSLKIKQLIFSTLKQIVESGISKQDIDSVLMGIELSLREIKRFHGPYSLIIMQNPIIAWLYGFDLEKSFRLRSVFEKVKNNIKTQDHYLENLIKEFLLENKSYSIVSVKPSKKYKKKRTIIENKIIKRLLKNTTLEKIKEENKLLEQYQSKVDDNSCIPHLNPKDFIKDGKAIVDVIQTDFEIVKNKNNEDINLFINKENTNGITYFEVGYPADVLDSGDFAWLPLFTSTVVDCGWKDVSWSEASEKFALNTGGVSVNLVDSAMSHTKRAEEYAKKYNWCGREWVIFGFKTLDEKLPTALSLLADCISKVDFADTERLQDIVNEYKNDIDSSIIPDGHEYAALRAKRKISRVHSIDEIWNGITLLYNIHKQAQNNQNENAEIFRRIFTELKAGGGFIHVTTEADNVDNVKKIIPDFINKIELTSLKQGKNIPTEEFIKMTNIEGELEEGQTEIFIVPAQVGYSAQCSEANAYGTEKNAVEEICTHWLSNILLWEKIRTKGGAYGAFCYTETLSNALIFSTYRDPKPYNSCDSFEECLIEASERNFTKEEVEKAIMGTYSSFIQPKTPKSRGSIGLIRSLFAIRDEDRAEKVLKILNTKESEIKNQFAELSSMLKRKKSRVIICDKNNKIAGKIITLPL